ncbi:MAG: hypothetical protein E7012_02120 [Alphaproteobacteria bacterium]|nr:hypothetical protein [Alphaproteobacteria bacterium]
MRYLLVTTTIIAGLTYTSSAMAQTCTAAPSCEEMGYTQSASDCAGKISLRCPFDLSAYLCGAVGSCDFSDYPLSSCPTGGNCTNTTCDGTTKYKLNSCNSGYTMSGNTCTANCNFTNYPLSSCPSNGNCSNYSCGGTTKYKLNSCKSGYTQSGNTCIYNDPCAGYYECGGSWQYCEGYTCSADSDMCSEYCVGDYFPYDCDSEYDCDDVGGVYRNGYCSEMCDGGNDYSSICIDISSCDNAYYDYDYECYTGCCDEYMDYGCDDLQCAGLLGTWIQECTGNSMCGAGFPFLECP